jgi:hypothetical protein
MNTSCLETDADWLVYADYLDEQNINHFVREDLDSSLSKCLELVLNYKNPGSFTYFVGSYLNCVGSLCQGVGYSAIVGSMSTNNVGSIY